ncbi:hypothetical protein pb186bvf_001178 [Paramecium bursaria]
MFSEIKKSIYYLIGGTIFAAFFHYNQKKYLEKEELHKTLQDTPVLTVDQLQVNRDIDKLVFVQGAIQGSKDSPKKLNILKSATVLFSQKTYTERQLHRHLNKEKNVRQFVESKTYSQPYVQINDHNKTLQIHNIKQAQFSQGVLKNYQKDKLYRDQKKWEIVRKPSNDQERALFDSGDRAQFTTYVIAFGLEINETALIEGTKLVALGKVSFQVKSNIIDMLKPMMVGLTKDQILEQIKSDIFLQELFGFFYALGAITFIGLSAYKIYKAISDDSK